MKYCKEGHLKHSDWKLCEACCPGSQDLELALDQAKQIVKLYQKEHPESFLAERWLNRVLPMGTHVK